MAKEGHRVDHFEGDVGHAPADPDGQLMKAARPYGWDVFDTRGTFDQFEQPQAFGPRVDLGQIEVGPDRAQEGEGAGCVQSLHFANVHGCAGASCDGLFKSLRRVAQGVRRPVAV